MARTEARIKTSIWIDDVFLSMEPMSKYLYMVLLSQPKVNNCGVMPYTPGSWANFTGLPKEDVVLAVKWLQSGNFVFVDESTDELWIRTLAKNDGVLNKPYMVIAMSKEFSTIQSPTIRARFLDELGADFVRQLPVKFPKGFGGDGDRDDPYELAAPFIVAFNRQFDG